ncbi:BIIDXI-like protein At5g11420 [Euphorbia lathyris]|uniref:BIIDXI-like protein At5g11420 n=1 Tax=Euphorbia lathyris TaxID=212925 RepID=UPI0033143B67
MIGRIFFLLLLLLGLAFADLLQNSDFETPPSNLAPNSTSPFRQLNETSSLFPGWSFQGTIFYVTTNQTTSLPDNGHAIQLAQDGKINQTFIPADYLHYLLTFTIAPSSQKCSDNTSIGISGPDSHAIFSFKQNYVKETWESYGIYLGSWEQQESINLIIESQATESDTNSTCWPLIDMILLKSLETLPPQNNNLLLNGGFELGPDFVINSSQGILLDAVSSPILSALRHWAIMGTVKYIDSQHYMVPEGKAAIEIVSGVSAGIQAATTLKEGSAYSLEFTLGDANDSCEGNFLVGAQAGPTAQNFSLQSNGTGSAAKFSLPFKADSMTVSVSFVSYTTTQTKDGVYCGPVIDNVILHAAYGIKSDIKWEVLIPLLFLVVIL